jgi:hypothetical protein
MTVLDSLSIAPEECELRLEVVAHSLREPRAPCRTRIVCRIVSKESRTSADALEDVEDRNQESIDRRSARSFRRNRDGAYVALVLEPAVNRGQGCLQDDTASSVMLAWSGWQWFYAKTILERYGRALPARTPRTRLRISSSPSGEPRLVVPCSRTVPNRR